MPQGLDTFFWRYSVLKQPANDITPWGLKNLVGDAIKTYVSNSSYQVSLQEEGRRCWTLDYSDGVQFHMDVLPAIRATKEPYQQELRKLKSYRSAAIGQTLGVASNLSAFLGAGIVAEAKMRSMLTIRRL